MLSAIIYFPNMAYRKALGSTQIETNQIANYAYVEWKDNRKISDSAPSEYHENIKQF